MDQPHVKINIEYMVICGKEFVKTQGLHLAKTLKISHQI